MTFSTTGLVVPTQPIWVGSGDQDTTGLPTLSFDGASVGVTYTAQLFEWQRIHRWVEYHGRVTLSNKGSSGGGLRIGAGAFPFPSVDAGFSGWPATIRLISMTAGVGDSHIVGDLVGGTGVPYLRVYKYASGTQIGLSNADVGNTSDFIFNGQYRVA